MIDGYAERAGVAPGEELILHVSTDAPEFRVEFYRWGAGMVPAGATEWMPGRCRPPHLPWQDWGEDAVGLGGEPLGAWPAYRFPVDPGWRPGVYVGVLVEGNGRTRCGERPAAGTPDARRGRLLFVVKAPATEAPAPLLYKVPLLTYHAYNLGCSGAYDPATGRGGWSLYTVPERRHLPVTVPPAVSLRRPGGGTGATPSDIANFDPFDPTPRQTFVHWDAPFVAWLERQRHPVDYCTDLDLHEAGEATLAGRRLLVSAGHDEYWSDAMRDGVERFVRRGGNVAFFGGNTCWWRVVFDDDTTFRRVGFWWEADGGHRPENTLTGVSFRNGGERDRDDHPRPVGFRVQHGDHWVYEGTGLADGDRFGDGPGEYLVGYECDGAAFDRGALRRGRPVRPTGDDGTPATFTILGVGDTEPSGWGTGNRAATLGVHADGGTVFNAGTTDWARLLGRGHRVVERITANVVDRLGGGPAPPARTPPS